MKQKLPVILLFRFKAMMKESLTNGEKMISQERDYKLFKSYVMYSTYYNFRCMADELVRMGLLVKSTCDCKLEKKREEQVKDCPCGNTEYLETEEASKLPHRVEDVNYAKT